MLPFRPKHDPNPGCESQCPFRSYRNRQTWVQNHKLNRWKSELSTSTQLTIVDFCNCITGLNYRTTSLSRSSVENFNLQHQKITELMFVKVVQPSALVNHLVTKMELPCCIFADVKVTELGNWEELTRDPERVVTKWDIPLSEDKSHLLIRVSEALTAVGENGVFEINTRNRG